MEGCLNVPVVSLHPYYNGTSVISSSTTTDDQRKAVVKEIEKASCSLGCFWVDVPEERYNVGIRNYILNSVDALFNAPTPDEKASLVNIQLPGSNTPRGFIAYGSESGSKSTFENKEGFAFGFSKWNMNGNNANGPKNDLEGINVWPDISDEKGKYFWCQEYQHILEDFLFDLFVEIGNILIRIYSAILYGGDETILENSWKGGETISLGRIFRYFNDTYEKMNKIDKTQYTDVLGSSQHTDWGLLTLILADDIPGLQIWNNESKSGNGEFSMLKPLFNKGKIFVNCGDYMSILSNGCFVSPLHRVVSPIGLFYPEESDPNANGNIVKNERRSIVFFFYPNYDSSIPKNDKVSQEYSIFWDQSLSGIEIPEMKTFGSFIKSKWEEVRRNNTNY